MKTLVASPFEDDAAEMLKWLYGDHAGFQMRVRVSEGQRVGQAFMNTLFQVDYAEYDRLAASSVNPFHHDKKIPAALDFLTSK